MGTIRFGFQSPISNEKNENFAFGLHRKKYCSTFAGLLKRLGHGVMVTQQILVLLFRVRVLVTQQVLSAIVC